MTKGGFFASGIAAFTGLIVVAFAGIVALMLFAVWAFVAALVAHTAVALVDARTPWDITKAIPAFIVPFMVAFLISGAAAFALDLIFKTYISLPAMIDGVDRLTHSVGARPVPLIESVLDYYRVALGPTPGTWLRFAGYYVVIVLVFAAVMRWFSLNIEPEPELYPEPQSPRQRRLRLLGVSVVAVGATALTLFPLTTWAMIGVRNLNH
jgi:hypothetical protein